MGADQKYAVRSEQEDASDSVLLLEVTDLELEPEPEPVWQAEPPHLVPVSEDECVDRRGEAVPRCTPGASFGRTSAATATQSPAPLGAEKFSKESKWRNARFTKKGPDLNMRYWVWLGALSLATLALATTGFAGMVCSLLAEEHCMMQFGGEDAASCAAGTFFVRTSSLKPPACRECPDQENCVQHELLCLASLNQKRCVEAASGYFISDGVPQRCNSMDAAVGVASCEQCSDGTQAGCTKGTCTAGYHTFVAGDPPTCTCAPVNPCPGFFSEPLTSRHIQYRTWQEEAYDLLDAPMWREHSPRSVAFAQRFCRPEPANVLDSSEERRASGGPTCAEIIADPAFPEFKCLSGFAPGGDAAGVCNTECGYNAAMAAVGACGVNGECCTCCPRDDETPERAQIRCANAEKDYRPVNGPSDFFDSVTGEPFRHLTECSDLPGWEDTEGNRCEQMPCAHGNVIVQNVWDSVVASDSVVVAVTNQAGVEEHRLLDQYDRDRSTLASLLPSRLDLLAPNGGPHAGKSALEACCKCGGGRQASPSVSTEADQTHEGNKPADLSQLVVKSDWFVRQKMMFFTVCAWVAGWVVFSAIRSYFLPPVDSVDMKLLDQLCFTYSRGADRDLCEWLVRIAEKAEEASRSQHTPFYAWDANWRLAISSVWNCVSIVLWTFAGDISPTWLQIVLLGCFFWTSQFVKHLISWHYSGMVATFMMLARPSPNQGGSCAHLRRSWSADTDADAEQVELDFEWTTRTRPSQVHALGAIAESSFWCGTWCLPELLASRLHLCGREKGVKLQNDKSSVRWLRGAKYALSLVSMYAHRPSWNFGRASNAAANLMHGTADPKKNDLWHQNSLTCGRAVLARLLAWRADRLNDEMTFLCIFFGLVCSIFFAVMTNANEVIVQGLDCAAAFSFGACCTSIMVARQEAFVHTVLLCFVEEPSFLRLVSCELYHKWYMNGASSTVQADDLGPELCLPEKLLQTLHLREPDEKKWKNAVRSALKEHFHPPDCVDQWFRWVRLHAKGHRPEPEVRADAELSNGGFIHELSVSYGARLAQFKKEIGMVLLESAVPGQASLQDLVPKPPPGKKHHFFICHHQGSGGDQAMNLAKDLKGLGFKVWYDNGVDANERNLQGMQKGVRESMALLIFLSGRKESKGQPDPEGLYEGPFTRPYCNEEMHAAHEAKVGFLGVKEDDPRHGKPDFKQEKTRALHGKDEGPVSAHAEHNVRLLDSVCFTTFEREAHLIPAMHQEILRQFLRLDVDGCRIEEYEARKQAQAIVEAGQPDVDRHQQGEPEMGANARPSPYALLLWEHAFALQQFRDTLTEKDSTVMKLRVALTGSRALTSSRRLNTADPCTPPPHDHPAEKFADALVQRGITTVEQVYEMTEPTVRKLLDEEMPKSSRKPEKRQRKLDNLLTEWMHTSHEHACQEVKAAKEKLDRSCYAQRHAQRYDDIRQAGRARRESLQETMQAQETTLAVLSDLDKTVLADKDELERKDAVAKSTLEARLGRKRNSNHQGIPTDAAHDSDEHSGENAADHTHDPVDEIREARQKRRVKFEAELVQYSLDGHVLDFEQQHFFSIDDLLEAEEEELQEKLGGLGLQKGDFRRLKRLRNEKLESSAVAA